MTINELAKMGAEIKLKELRLEIKHIKSLLAARKGPVKEKVKRAMTPARRRAIMANLAKAHAASRAKKRKFTVTPKALKAMRRNAKIARAARLTKLNGK